jgi:alpha-beta hydrolase superfamily lysophospholipase
MNSKLITSALAIAAAIGITYIAMSPRYAKTWFYQKRVFKYGEEVAPQRELLATFRHEDKSQHFFPAKDGHQMHGWHFRKKNASHVALYCIGRTSCITNCLDNLAMLAAADFSIFIFEYRGFGESEGRSKKMPSIESICDDGLTAIDYVVGALGYQPNEIVIYGESLGTGVAAHIAENREVSGLILQSGFASLKRIGHDLIPFLRLYPRWLYPKHHLDTEGILKRLKSPVLILHGQKDEVIPYAHAEVLYNASAATNKRLVPLPNSMHRFIWLTDTETCTSAIRDFRQSL